VEDEVKMKLGVLVKMATKDQDAFLAEWIALWDDMSDRALDAATVLLRTMPDDTTRIDQMLRLSYRCTMLMSLVARMRVEPSEPLDFDPPVEMLEEMRTTYLTRVHTQSKEAH
jgi:hypothetical protein